MIGAILHYLLAFGLLAITIVVNAAVTLGAILLIASTWVWLVGRLSQMRHRRRLGIPPPMLRYRMSWLQGRGDWLFKSSAGPGEISAVAAMKIVQARVTHATFREQGAISVADGMAARLEEAAPASSHRIRECWVVYVHNKQQGPCDGRAYLIEKRTGNLAHQGAAQDILRLPIFSEGNHTMDEEAYPLIQPPWRAIVLEALQANDPERHRELKKTPDHLEHFVVNLVRRAEKTYDRIASSTEETYGPLQTWKLAAIQEIVMQDVILGEIPRP